MDLVKVHEVYTKLLLTLELIKAQSKLVNRYECTKGKNQSYHFIIINIGEANTDILICYEDAMQLELTAEAVMLGLMSKYIYGNSTDNIFNNFNEDNGKQENPGENSTDNQSQKESAGENESGQGNDSDPEDAEAESKESDWETNGERAGRRRHS